MISLKSICGIPCSVCKEFLAAPIVTLNECHHGMHKQCFEETSKHESSCPECHSKITVGIEDAKLEQLIIKMNQLSLSVLRAYSREPLLERLLHKAVKKGEVEAVSFFLAKGASLFRLIEGVSPLDRACATGQIEVARVLLQKGADPMQAAYSIGKGRILDLLIEYHAPFDLPDAQGRTPLFMAVHNRNEDLACGLIKKGANVRIRDHYGISLLSMATRCEMVDVVSEILKKGVDVNQQDEDGSTALHDAAGRTNSKMLSFLLQNGAKASINVSKLNKWTPLTCAVFGGNLKNVGLLVEEGADLFLRYTGVGVLEMNKRMDICTFAWNEFIKCKNFYRTHRLIGKEEKREIQQKQIIAEYLQLKCNNHERSIFY